MRFGTLLKRLRRKAGLAHGQLAERLGCSRTCVCLWEKHASSPTHANMAKLAAALEVDLVELVSCRFPPDGRQHRLKARAQA
jgi:predicted transcriptional regulator